MRHEAPQPQFAVRADLSRIGETSLRSDGAVGTFSVLCPSNPNEEDCGICFTGALAPCCLVGSTVIMRDSGFTTRVDPCDGCGGPCCGVCLSGCLLSGLFGYVGAMINGCVAMQCMDPYGSDLRADDRFVRWICLSFCFPCETCASYKNALRQVRKRPLHE